MTPQEIFIGQIAPAAQASMQVTKIFASFTIAEAALESGWGKSGLVAKCCNLFGVKADASWHGDIFCMPTNECIKGKNVTVQAKWRKYPDWQSCMDDHAQFLLKNPRYAHALTCTDVESFAHGIQEAGYATDPRYAAKIIAIIRTYKLTAFDKLS